MAVGQGEHIAQGNLPPVRVDRPTLLPGGLEVFALQTEAHDPPQSDVGHRHHRIHSGERRHQEFTGPAPFASVCRPQDAIVVEAKHGRVAPVDDPDAPFIDDDASDTGEEASGELGGDDGLGNFPGEVHGVDLGSERDWCQADDDGEGQGM